MKILGIILLILGIAFIIGGIREFVKSSKTGRIADIFLAILDIFSDGFISNIGAVIFGFILIFFSILFFIKS